MSWYVSLYLQPRSKEGEEKKKPIFFSDWSKNSNIGSVMLDELEIVMYPDGELSEENMTQLTVNDINNVQRVVEQDINNYNKRIKEYRNHANGNIEIIDEILSLQTTIEELEEVYQYLKFLGGMVADFKYHEYYGFDKLLAVQG